MEVDYVYLSFAVGTLIPLAVSLLTKYVAPNSVRALINLFLSAVVGAVTPVLASCVDTSCILVPEEILPSIAMAWIASVASYHGFLNPVGATTKVASSTKRFGIGPSRQPSEDQGEAKSEENKEGEQGQGSSNVTLLSRLSDYSRNQDA